MPEPQAKLRQINGRFCAKNHVYFLPLRAKYEWTSGGNWKVTFPSSLLWRWSGGNEMGLLNGYKMWTNGLLLKWWGEVNLTSLTHTHRRVQAYFRMKVFAMMIELCRICGGVDASSLELLVSKRVNPIPHWCTVGKKGTGVYPPPPLSVAYPAICGDRTAPFRWKPEMDYGPRLKA